MLCLIYILGNVLEILIKFINNRLKIFATTRDLKKRKWEKHKEKEKGYTNDIHITNSFKNKSKYILIYIEISNL